MESKTYVLFGIPDQAHLQLAKRCVDAQSMIANCWQELALSCPLLRFDRLHILDPQDGSVNEVAWDEALRRYKTHLDEWRADRKQAE